jgi:PAS domain S-box-containing protein
MNDINSPSGVILIVDDTPSNLMPMLDYLTTSGFEVLVALDGESAIRQAEYAQPDIILLDILMPEIDGFDTCRRLKANEPTKDIPVIFMTALSEMGSKVEGFQVGAVDYITKPIQHEEVLSRVQTHLTMRKLYNQLQEQNLQLQKEIGDRTLAEAALAKMNAELEDRVIERTTQLKQTIEKLEDEKAERQITESYLQQSEVRFQKLAANLPGIVYRYCLYPHSKGFFPYVSAGCLSLLELEPVEIQQNADLLWRTIHPDDLASISESVAISAQTLTPWQWEGRIIVKGKNKWIAVVARPERLESGKIFWDGLMIDITKRKLAEAALQQAKVELEDRVAQRTAELQAVNEQLRSEIQAHNITEAALRLSEERYAIAVSGSAMGVWDWNLKTKEIYISSSLKSMLGYSDREINSQLDDWLLLVHPDDREAMAAAINAHLAGVTSQCEIEHRMVHKDGSIRWILARGTVMRDDQGQPYRMAGTDTDITYRAQIEKQLKESQEFLHHTLNAIADPIFVKDEQHRWLKVNDALCHFLGYSKNQLIGKSDYDFFPKEQADVFWEKDALVFSSGLENQHEEKITDSEGKTHIISTKKSIFQDESGNKILVGTIRDITEIVAAKEAALEASRLKSQFLANISHELRTPMNGVIGMTDLLLKTNLDAHQRDFVQTIRISGDNLLELINDILDFSKLESGKMRLEKVEFDLDSTLEEVVSMVAAQANAKAIRLRASVEGKGTRQLVGDAKRLRQILVNLTDNAIKFTNQGEVAIAVEIREPSSFISTRGEEAKSQKLEEFSGYILRFSVKDTGIGIAPENQTKLFQSFSQVDGSTTRRYGGTGLGLAICKQLVELMRGEIGVTSELGKGSEFWFAVPFEKSYSCKKSAAPILNLEFGYGKEENFEPIYVQPSKDIFTMQNIQSEYSGKKQICKVLLVEDTPINQKVVMNQLKVLGYEADCAVNGQEAIDRMTHAAYDLVLMDCQMPVLDGYEATRKIRDREGKESHTLIIALTANAMSGDREKCLAAGMDDYISKPISLKELKAVIERWIHNTNEPAGKQEENPASNIQNPKAEEEPVDRDRLHELSRGDAEFQIELLQAFVDDAQIYLQDAKVALKAVDCETIIRRAHQLKGGSATVAIRLMPDLAAKLESQARSNQLQGADELIAELEKALERVKAFIAAC